MNRWTMNHLVPEADNRKIEGQYAQKPAILFSALWMQRYLVIETSLVSLF